MGNGGWLGGNLGTGSQKSAVGIRTAGAFFLLLLAAVAVLALGSRRSAHQASDSGSRSPILTSSRSPLSTRPHSKPEARAVLGKLPLIFEPNQGQADPRVKFLARGAGYGLFLDATGAVLSIPTPRSSHTEPSQQFVHMKLVGANSSATTAGVNPLPGKTNYLIGNDPGKWQRGISQFAGVRYASVYPGIDLVFYGNDGRLEYDFRVSPGADPAKAELQFDGANNLQLTGGDLILASANGKDESPVRFHAPQIYQVDGDRRKPVEGRFALHAGNRVGFEIGAYDHSRELVIDPVLVFATYFGGSGAESSPSVAVNGDGFIYIVGSTTSPQTSFPTSGFNTSIPPTQPFSASGPFHIFVAKINPTQPSAVVYETFLGGNGTDTSVGIGVDNADNVYIAGTTSSTNFPTSTTGYQSAPLPKGTQCTGITCTSVFVDELSGLDPTGATLLYGTYLSGNGNDQASGMAIDSQGDIFVTGTTSSNNTATTVINGTVPVFPATSAPIPYQGAPAPGSTVQFFATKVNTNLPSFGGVAYSTYFGGSTPTPAVATGGGITVDFNGNMYFTGTTNFYNSGSGSYGNSGAVTDFPILNAYQPCLDTPPPTVLANSNPCTAPTFTPYPTDAFVAKINPLAAAGAQLLFSTYLGGSVSDSGTGIAIDSSATNIYITGSTNSPDFVLPTSSTPFQSCLDTPPASPPLPPPCPVASTPAAPAPTDAFVARMSNPTLSTNGTPNDVLLTYFSYLGGSGNDSGLAIAVDSTIVSDTLNDALITGTTSSTNFPVTLGAIQGHLGATGAQNAFFAHIDTTTTTSTNQAGDFVTYYGGDGMDIGTGIAVDPFLNTYFVGSTTSDTGTFETEDPLPGTPGGGTLNGPSDAFVVQLAPANSLSLTSVPPVISPNTGFASAGNSVTITFTVANQGLDPATGISVTGSVPAGVTFNSATAQTGTCGAPASNTVVCTIPTLQAGATSQVGFVVTPNSKGNYAATIKVVNVNNTTTNVTNTQSFQASDFFMNVSPSSQSIAAGQIASYSIQVNPDPVFDSNVSLTCSALPGGTTCSFANSTLTPNGTSASTVLKINTTAQPVDTVASRWHRSFYALWLMIPGMAWLGLGAAGKRRRRLSRVLGLFALSLIFGLILLLPSCGGNSTPPPVSGTPSGTYTLKVTATSGSFTQSQAFQLTVTP